MNRNQVQNQIDIEETFSRKKIAGVIRQYLLQDSDVVEAIQSAKQALLEWSEQEYYASKNERIRQFMERHSERLDDLILDIFEVVLVHELPEQLVSVVGVLIGKLGLSDQSRGAVMVAELLTVLSSSGAFGVHKSGENQDAPWVVTSYWEVPSELRAYILHTKYLPPMVVEPLEVTQNFETGLLTERGSLILGKGNYHEKDICLDSINRFNRVPLKLNVELLCELGEEPKQEFKEADKRRQWRTFVDESYQTYRDLYRLGNQFWLTHRVDKRGRTYAQGYHISTQGNSFRKAIIEFADEEIIEGI